MADSTYILSKIPGPVRVVFEPTISCNLQCPMCDRTRKSDFLKHRDNKMPSETIIRCLNDLSGLGTKQILIIGGGEPLAEPNILQYIEIIKSHHIDVHLWTNGTLISESNAHFLAEHCDMITVSLDSPDPNANDRSRGVPGSTEKSIAGIKLLRKYSDRLYLRIHSVISALNIDHLPNFVDFAKMEGLNEIGGAILNQFEFVPKYMRFSEVQKATLDSKLSELRTLAHKEGVTLAGCYENISGNIIKKLKSEIGKIDGSKCITCLGLWSQATIRPNGDVSICCFTYKPILGNLHDKTILEIWQSEHANSFRDYVKNGKFIDKPCIGCDLGNPVFTQLLEKDGSLDLFNDMIIHSR